MLTIKQIRDERQETIARLEKKNVVDVAAKLDAIIALDDARRAIQQQLDNSLAEQNTIAKLIGQCFKTGEATKADELKKRVSDLKTASAELSDKMAATEQQIESLAVLLPNRAADIVPVGRAAADNLNVKQAGEMPNLPRGAKPHWEIVAAKDIIDFDLGVKLTGAGFPVYKGKGARLQRALINFFVDCNTQAGYMEIMPPLMVNEASGFGTGQLPDKEGQMYHCTVDNFYMIPTAEVPVTNIYRDVIVEEKELPIKLTAYTPCFRREAGSYGKDVRGLNRLHQFDKVEIVEIANPATSYDRLTAMVAHVESIVIKLGLPYRILRLCGGDMSFTSALTYDFEVYSAAQEKWLEVSSVSNFESFQANRLKLRYRDADRKLQLAHTLNGSSLALPRILAALIENNQTEDGSIMIPEVLRSYTGFDKI
ncbi:MAG: serine--tRNA ligase [Mucinivorans sp.]